MYSYCTNLVYSVYMREIEEKLAWSLFFMNVALHKKAIIMLPFVDLDGKNEQMVGKFVWDIRIPS